MKYRDYVSPRLILQADPSLPEVSVLHVPHACAHCGTETEYYLYALDAACCSQECHRELELKHRRSSHDQP